MFPKFKNKLIVAICLIWISFKSAVGTTLIIATGEVPPYISETPNESFLTDLFQQIAHEMDVTFSVAVFPCWT